LFVAATTAEPQDVVLQIARRSIGFEFWHRNSRYETGDDSGAYIRVVVDDDDDDDDDDN
jgi:hypothetical protein